MNKNQKKHLAIITLSLLAIVGTYNALMINSGSLLSAQDASFKRIDEVYGVVKTGRSIAVSTDWRKVSKVEQKQVSMAQAAWFAKDQASAEVHVEAAVTETLNMKLVEVMNPKKWEKGITAADFSGNIATNNGIIESLNASLPDGLSIEISFSEMAGNTFEYDLNGEIYSGMMYQVDQSSYMITMTSGPLEGTRMRFAGEANDADAAQNYLAENHNVEIGTFGEEMEAPQAESETEVSTQVAEASAFNFNQI